MDRKLGWSTGKCDPNIQNTEQKGARPLSPKPRMKKPKKEAGDRVGCAQRVY